MEEENQVGKNPDSPLAHIRNSSKKLTEAQGSLQTLIKISSSGRDDGFNKLLEIVGQMGESLADMQKAIDGVARESVRNRVKSV